MNEELSKQQKEYLELIHIVSTFDFQAAMYMRERMSLWDLIPHSLMSAFAWYDSPQGYDFWGYIFSNYE